jgi:hypothetical protein
MDNFKKSANQLWKESNTTLSFKDWLDRENAKAVDSLGLDSNKFEDALGITKKNVYERDTNKFLGLNKWLLISSVLVIGGAIAYKVYNKNK